MRILHLLDHGPPVYSAYSRRALALLQAQRERGWHTIQLTGPNQGHSEAPDRNDGRLRFFRTAPPRWPLARLPLLREAAAVAAMARRLEHAARLGRPDLLHAHPPLSNAWAALRAGRRLGLPVLVQLPASFAQARLARALALHAARRGAMLAAPNAALLRQLLDWGLPAARLLLAPEPLGARLAPPRPREAALAARLGLDQGPVLGFAGELGSPGGALLLAALPALLRRHPRLVLLVFGGMPAPGSGRPRLPVVASGPIAPADAGRYLDLADILAWPQPDQAGAGAGLLEAMARGAVLAASDIPAHRDLLLHGSNGILFEAGHAGAIVEALGALLDEPACWPRLREGARKHAEREFGAAACAARFAPAYARLLEDQRH